MSSAVEYLIAQHVPDVFRQEPKNLGVIVRRGHTVEARFFGERSPGMIDGRSLRAFQFPDVYRQWVDFWRRRSSAPGDPFRELEGANAAHFRVVSGGEVSDVASADPLADVANYLYSMLVSEGGLMEALGGAEDGDSPVLSLRDAVAEELSHLNLLAGADEELPLVRHPVRRGVTLKGYADEPHHPAFYQDDGRACIIETVDFTVHDKERAKDHAGLASYMFGDLRRSALRNAETIALIRSTPADEDYSTVRYGLSLLRNESTLVNWAEDGTRASFLADRTRIAIGV
jgi:hypothetical protein